MPYLKHYEHTGTARFITLSCYHNYNLFKTDQTKDFHNEFETIKI